MNREIEFRGKRKDNNEWVYGGYMKNINGIYITDTTNYHLNATYKNYIVFPETIGQYTGLNDKNGKKIFEGDIVTDGTSNYIVVWRDYSFKLYSDNNYYFNLDDFIGIEVMLCRRWISI